MELKEGMFIRTKNGNIDEVIYDYDGHCASPNCDCKHVSCKYDYYNEDDIIKVDEELPALLDRGDFVDTHLISVIKDRTIFFTDGFFIDFYDVEDLAYMIVTKEQFESIGYKIDGE